MFSAYVSASARLLSSPGTRGRAAHAHRPQAGAAVLVAYKIVADVASKIVTLVVTVAAARALSASDFGVMALAMTTGWLLGVASDAGLPMFAATRVALAQAHGRGVYSIVRGVMRWRLGLAGGAAAAGLAFALTFLPAGALLPFTLIVLHQLFGAMVDTVAHVYRGLSRTDIESTLALVHRSAIAVAALTVLLVYPTLLALAVALTVPSLLALVVSCLVVRRVADDGPEFRLDAAAFRTQVAPLGLGVLLAALYFRIDVYFLERLHGIDMVGQYNAAFRLVDALRLFAAASLAVAYPTLCAASSLRPVRRLSAALLASSIVLAVPLYLAAAPLLRFVYGAPFFAAGRALQALLFSLPLFFLNYALTHQLIAWDRQHAYLRIAGAALVTNLVCNLWLIPRYAMMGAAYSTFLTEVAVCVGCLWALRSR